MHENSIFKEMLKEQEKTNKLLSEILEIIKVDSNPKPATEFGNIFGKVQKGETNAS